MYSHLRIKFARSSQEWACRSHKVKYTDVCVYVRSLYPVGHLQCVHLYSRAATTVQLLYTAMTGPSKVMCVA